MSAPTPGKRFDPANICIYCGAAQSADGSALSDEHIIPEGMGGKLILPNASCKACRDKTSLFERNFQREMYPAIRAVFELYGKRRKATRPGSFPIDFDDRTRTEYVPLDEYPLLVQMPILDGPGLLSNRSPSATEFPDLTKPGRLWTWQASDAAERAEALLKKHGAANVAPAQKIFLTDFFKMVAKIAHSYDIAARGYKPHARYFLQRLITAPPEMVTNGATYFVGTAHTARGTLLRPDETGDTYLLRRQAYVSFLDMYQIVTVQIQLFAMLGAPIYEAVVYTWPPLVG
jgi:hypothetical protein